jgi:dienelactone hydrolase
MKALATVVLCTLLSSSLATAKAEAPRVLPRGQLPHDQRLGPQKDLNDYFPFAPCATREAWARRAAQLRRQMLVAAGLWPMPVTKSGSPVVHGRVDREGYTVEKVILETYPGYYLTGSLYRPKGRSGKLPAVLSPHGHWPEGRFYDAGAKEIRRQIVDGAERFELSGRYPLQARCVQLARMGCVVFHYDMVGNADSHQLAHRAGARADMNDPKRWGFFSPQAEARLQTIFGLQTYNSIRAMDFLSGLPDVDPTRIGVTGASGGGTQTLIFCALDPRPAVSFPAVMVSTAMQGGCPCENACYLRLGTGNIELAALFAPKPLGMTAADDWTKEIATKGLPELKQHYRSFGAEDLVMAKPLVHFPHNYNYVSRAVMYHWFNKHLKLGLEEPIVEEDFRPLSVAEMTVWDAAHPAPPLGDEFERALVERMTADTRRQIEALRPTNEASLQEYRRIVGGPWR